MAMECHCKQDFIDDIFAVILIWGDDRFDSDKWNQFKEDVDDCGILKWNIKKLYLSVNYLDQTVQAVNGHFITKKYQKPINLYQYIIRPNFAHPPWTIKGMISSMIQKYFYQNTHRDDSSNVAMHFYKRLKTRGWVSATLEPTYIMCCHTQQ